MKIYTLLGSLVLLLALLLLPQVAPASASDPTLEEIFSILEAHNPNPTTFEDYDRLATMAYARGDYAAALAHIEKCVALAGDDAATLGALLTQRGAILEKQSLPADALAAYNEAHTHTPDSPRLLLARATLLLAQGDYSSASTDLAHYVTLLPEDADAHALLAKAYRGLGNKEKASEAEARAEVLAQDEGSAILTAARQSALYGDLAAARDGYLVYLDANDDDGGQIHFLLATARMELGEIEDAIADLEAAIALGYDEPAVCYEYLSSCHFVLGSYDRVLQTGEAALLLGSDKPAYDTLYQRMGISALSLGDAPAAVDYFTEAMKANDALLGSLYYRALAYMSQEDWEAAEQDFTASIDREELVQRCLYNRGLCRAQRGDIPAAVKDLEAAMDRNEEESVTQDAEEILWQLALAYMSQMDEAK